MADTNMLLVSVGALTSAFAAYKLWQRDVHPLPPSPRSYPLIGHLLSMPARGEHLGSIELGKQLNSDIISLSVFGTTIIALNSSEGATNLLEKRSAIYSDRVCPPMIEEPSSMNWRNFISMLRYNDRWKMARRLMDPWLHRKAAEAFHPSQQLQARLLLQRLLHVSDDLRSSEQLEVEFDRATATTLSHSIYGYDLKSSDDPFLLNIKLAMENGTRAALPSNFLVNLFPSLLYVPDWFPGTEWKCLAREWRDQQEYTVDSSYAWAKAQITTGASKPSIIASLLNHAKSLGLEPGQIDDHIKQLAVTLFAGGTDTTTATLLVFVLAMLLFPETQKKAQNELDSVIGLDRLPVMNDLPNLRYIDRLLQELLRWCPIVPSGVPHACYQDDVYKGYRFPKGAIVIGNIWAIARDPNVYKNPEIFDPDRYLDPEVPPSPTFGFGRRMCPGNHYARASVFISIASILMVFNIEYSLDDSGNKIIPKLEGENRTIHYPKPFKVKLTPRSEMHEALVRGEE